MKVMDDIDKTTLFNVDKYMLSCSDVWMAIFWQLKKND